MATQSPAMGPLDEVLGTLLECWDQRYRFEMNRAERVLFLSKPPDNEVVAREVADGRIQVIYQPSPDETAEEYCSVARAVQLIEALMARERLDPVGPALVDRQPPAASKGGWLARLFGRR